MKTKLSNNTLLKFFNKELSNKETKRVGTIIDNSDTYKKTLNELNATYSLTSEKKKLEDNPYLFMKIINEITENKNQSSIYNSYFLKGLFQPIIAISLILITIYTGYTIGNIHTETTNQLTDLNYTSEIYFNDLQLEKIETLLLMKD